MDEISIFNTIRIMKSYSSKLPTTIQFEVNTFFKTNYSFEFTIKEELKSKVNETVQKYVL